MRVTVIVIDSFGIGYLPDAALYNDKGANTAMHICENMPNGANWPNLQKLGLGNASELLGNKLKGCPASKQPLASFGAMKEASAGKDTTTGHWELAGIILDKAFPVFSPDFPSFPPELVSEFEKAVGRKIIGNKAASGTAIIEELGKEHMETGNLICYTSADSVFQIAAHEEVVSIDKLYKICETARRLCDPYMVGRVIARPFVGKPGSFTRTSRRHDYSIALPESSIMDHLKESGILTTGIGKIGDIFNQQGIDNSLPDKGNPACIDRTIELLSKNSGKDEFIFVNLVDTDMLYGHRRDIRGYHDAIKEIDDKLPQIMSFMKPEDILVLTADHGCDPSFKGTDHTREHVPVLFFRKDTTGVSLGIRETFADLPQTIASAFGINKIKNGLKFNI